MAKRTPPNNQDKNPFSALKGFCVSPAASAQSPISRAAPPKVTANNVSDEPVDFAAAMAQLGVRRTRDALVPVEQPESTAPAPDDHEAAPSEDEEFFRAVSGMTPAFRDEYPDEPTVATPRLTKLVRKGELSPESTLDLHGVTRETLREKLRWFFENSHYQGLRLVLIITGRGKSSGTEPVLRGEVIRYLTRDAAAWVAEWDRAPGRLGGDGALLVLLKVKKS